jgi:hypothetical protein
MRESKVCKIRNWISTPWLTASVMMLIIDGTTRCGTALRAIRRWSEPKDMPTTFAFLVAHPINTGLNNSSDCGPSAETKGT